MHIILKAFNNQKYCMPQFAVLTRLNEVYLIFPDHYHTSFYWKISLFYLFYLQNVFIFS